MPPGFLIIFSFNLLSMLKGHVSSLSWLAYVEHLQEVLSFSCTARKKGKEMIGIKQ